MQLSKDDLAKLELIQRFLQHGTFTLKGAEVSVFIETRLWLKSFMEKGIKPPMDMKPIVTEKIKPIRKKKK